MEKCYLCGGKLIETNYKLRDSNTLKVLKCKKCGLEVLSDFSHIDNDFYKKGLMLSTSVNPDRWLMASKPDDLRRFNKLKKILSNKKILDFGCGAGGFIELANTICDTTGIEKQETMANYIKSKNLKLYSDIKDLKNEKFDIITMFHVMEHLSNPKETISDLKKFLNKNGKIIIEVPNTNDALLSLYNCKAFSDYTHWKCHLWGFNDKNLKFMLKTIGFKNIKIKKIQRYNFLNHINWLFSKKPGGHKTLKLYYSYILDYLYTLFLKSISKTDTLIAICEN